MIETIKEPKLRDCIVKNWRARFSCEECLAYPVWWFFKNHLFINIYRENFRQNISCDLTKTLKYLTILCWNSHRVLIKLELKVIFLHCMLHCSRYFCLTSFFTQSWWSVCLLSICELTARCAIYVTKFVHALCPSA